MSYYRRIPNILLRYSLSVPADCYNVAADDNAYMERSCWRWYFLVNRIEQPLINKIIGS